MGFVDQMQAIGSRAGVWQVVPPSDYKDRLAGEGAPATPAGGFPLTNHGGSTIPNPKLVLIYLGAWWNDTAKLEAFAADLMTAGYLAPLSDYGSGNGQFLGSIHGPAVSGTVTDAQLQAILSAMISSPPAGFPMPDGHTLYALCLPSGVVVNDGNGVSCTAFCGYHDALPDGKTFYTVQPASDCQGCYISDPFSGFTMVLAHEVAEACTDAVPGQGWFADVNGMENSDQFAWIPGPYGPWTVQGYQLNGVGNSLSVIKYAVPSPDPQPQQYSFSVKGPMSPIVGQTVIYSSTLAPNVDGLTYAWSVNGNTIPGATGPTLSVSLQAQGPLSIVCGVTPPGGTRVTASLVAQVQLQQQPQPQGLPSDAFWKWLVDVGNYELTQPEAARVVEAPVVRQQLSRFYPNAAGPVMGLDAPVPPPGE